MAMQKKARAPRGAARLPSDLADERFQRAIDREHELSWREYQQRGSNPPLARFPAIKQLLEACQEAERRGYRFHSRVFCFRGRRFPVVFTSLGRIRVMHPWTRLAIGSTAYFSAG